MPPIQLDQHQTAVAKFRAGLAVCSAAAGSGKTTVLVERTRQLIVEGVHPRLIAILVYNRDAAQTFRDRLRLAVGDRANGVTVSTFHSWALGLLRAWYPGDPRFEVRRVLGADGSQIRAGDLVFPIKDEKNPDGRTLKYPLSATLDQILSASDLLAESLYDLRPGAPDLDETALRNVAELLEVRDAVPWIAFLRALEARKAALRTISFADMIFLVAHAMRTTPEAPHVLPLCGVYPYLMGDEAQDINKGRLTIIEHLARGTQSTLLVGDPRQCQPAGSRVLTPTGWRCIEELRDGDVVTGWSRSSAFVGGKRPVKVACRPYTGWLFTITTSNGEVTTCTDTHKWLVRWSESARDLAMVYIMRRLYAVGTAYRIGWCKVLDETGGYRAHHYKLRARLELAEALWIVSTFKERALASAWESILSARYQIPTAMFMARAENEVYTQDILDLIWTESAATSTMGAARLAMASKLNLDHPLWHPNMPGGRQTLFETAAVNLSTGMSIPVWDGHRGFVWTEIAKIESTWVTDLPVYSLDVATDHAYVTDGGICTLNSIYGFTGALPSVLQRVIQDWGAGLLTLPINRRSTEAIVELANAVARGQSWNLGGDCSPRPGAPRGTTPSVLRCDDIHEAARETALLAGAALERGQTVAVLARVNQDLLAVESACVALGLGVQTLGEKGGAWEGRMGAYLRAYLAACEGQITAELYDVIHLPKRFASNAALFAALKPLPRVATPADLFAALDAATALKDGKQVPQEGVRRFGRELRGLAALPWSARVRRIRSYVADGIQDREKDSPRAAQDHIEALDYLADHAIELGSWAALQDYRAQVASSSGERLVVLSSIHRAKGQEWDLVIGFAIDDDRLPLARSTDRDEERRLFYVLVTRARTELVLVHDGDPSPFLDEPGIAACLSKA